MVPPKKPPVSFANYNRFFILLSCFTCPTFFYAAYRSQTVRTQFPFIYPPEFSGLDTYLLMVSVVAFTLLTPAFGFVYETLPVPWFEDEPTNLAKGCGTVARGILVIGGIVVYDETSLHALALQVSVYLHCVCFMRIAKAHFDWHLQDGFLVSAVARVWAVEGHPWVRLAVFALLAVMAFLRYKFEGYEAHWRNEEAACRKKKKLRQSM